MYTSLSPHGLVMPHENDVARTFFDRSCYEDAGWDFGHGDPELFALRDWLADRKGTVLDLGAGALRASEVFAVDGRPITAVDASAYASRRLEELRDELGFELDIHEEDMAQYLKKAAPSDRFDLAILALSLVHMNARTDGIDVIQAAYGRLKPGGKLWVRAATTLDSNYFPDDYMPNDDPNIREELCSCSGEARYEPMLYFNPLDVHLALGGLGARITHSQVLPEKGKANIRFGEDCGVYPSWAQAGFVTVLAERPTR